MEKIYKGPAKGPYFCPRFLNIIEKLNLDPETEFEVNAYSKDKKEVFYKFKTLKVNLEAKFESNLAEITLFGIESSEKS